MDPNRPLWLVGRGDWPQSFRLLGVSFHKADAMGWIEGPRDFMLPVPVGDRVGDPMGVIRPFVSESAPATAEELPGAPQNDVLCEGEVYNGEEDHRRRCRNRGHRG